MPDESAFAGRENVDPDHVARYDDKEDSGAIEEIAFLQQYGLGARSIVVDVGAGTGQFVSAAAPHVAQVIAADVSEPMLRRLRARVDAERLEHVTVERAGFLELELPVGGVDVVYSRLALHHLPDFWKSIALQRVAAWLKPGGHLRLVDVVYDFAVEDASQCLERWCSTGRAVPVGEAVEDGWARWEIEEHVRDEHSTYSWILEGLAGRSGFTIEVKSYDSAAMMASYLFRRS